MSLNRKHLYEKVIVTVIITAHWPCLGLWLGTREQAISTFICPMNIVQFSLMKNGASWLNQLVAHLISDVHLSESIDILERSRHTLALPSIQAAACCQSKPCMVATDCQVNHVCSLHTSSQNHVCSLQTANLKHVCSLQTASLNHVCSLQTASLNYVCSLQTASLNHVCSLQTASLNHVCSLQTASQEPCMLATDCQSEPCMLATDCQFKACMLATDYQSEPFMSATECQSKPCTVCSLQTTLGFLRLPPTCRDMLSTSPILVGLYALLSKIRCRIPPITPQWLFVNAQS